MNYKTIYSSTDFVKIQRIKALLEENDITIIQQPLESTFVFGDNLNQNIIVHIDSVNEALELIKSIDIPIEEVTSPSPSTHIRSSKPIKTYVTLSFLFFLFILINNSSFTNWSWSVVVEIYHSCFPL